MSYIENCHLPISPVWKIIPNMAELVRLIWPNKVRKTIPQSSPWIDGIETIPKWVVYYCFHHFKTTLLKIQEAYISIIFTSPFFQCGRADQNDYREVSDYRPCPTALRDIIKCPKHHPPEIPPVAGWAGVVGGWWWMVPRFFAVISMRPWFGTFWGYMRPLDFCRSPKVANVSWIKWRFPKMEVPNPF